MPSPESQKISDLYRSWSARARADSTIQDVRGFFAEWQQLTREPEGVEYSEEDISGVPAIWIKPRDCSTRHVLLCAHGGGYVGGSAASHRKMFGHLAKAVGCLAIDVDYRLVPEFPHPTPVEDMAAVYRWLIEKGGYKPEHIALAGDSAGGALSLTTIENIRRQGLPLPAATMPMSPWCCGDHSGDSYQYNKDKDLVANPDFSGWLADIVLGEEGDRSDPLSNPLYIDYTGFPPIHVQVGGDEAVLDDGRRIVAKAKSQGVDAQVDVVADMQHCFQLMAGWAPESDDAIRRLATWVKPILGL